MDYLVSYQRYEDEVCSTNIVHADSYEKVTEEFDSCHWFVAREAKVWEVESAKAKGMPERRL